MNWNDGITEFGFDCKVRKLSPKTISNYTKQLWYFQRFVKAEFNIEKVERVKPVHINMYLGPEHDVTIRFHKTLADAVIDEFGEQINMMYVDADHFSIRAPIALSPTFFAWVASFGKRAKIMEPPAAVEGMKKFINNVSCMYEDDPDM